jgi:hypothetical protein
MLYGKLYATRRRPKMRWLDDVSMDLRKMGVKEWRGRTRIREAWRRIVEGAKAQPRAVAPFGGGSLFATPSLFRLSKIFYL